MSSSLFLFVVWFCVGYAAINVVFFLLGYFLIEVKHSLMIKGKESKWD